MEKAKKEKDNVSMRYLNLKTKPSENIAFASIIAALYCVLSFLIAFFPSLSIPFAIFLPLFSALVGTLCLPTYVFSFAIGSSLLCLGVSYFNVGEILFSVIPSILTGSFFGMLLKRKVQDELIIVLVSLLQMGLNYLAVFLLRNAFGLDPIDTFLKLFKVERTSRIDALIPSLLLTVSFLQTSLTNFLVGLLAMRLTLPETKCFSFPKTTLPILGLCSVFLTMSIGYFNLLFGSLFLVFSIYFAIVSVSLLLKEKRWWIYLLGGIALLFLFFLRTALLNHYQEGILLYSLFTLPLDFIALFSNLLKRRENDEIS